MKRGVPTIPALLLLALPAWPAQPAEQPATLQLGAPSPLALAAQATRTAMLGRVDLYSIALYVPELPLDRARLASPDTPKALRIVVRYDPDLRPRSPVDWWRELVPKVDAPAATHLRGVFAPVRAGDVVLVSYLPNKGTTVRVGTGVAVPEATHDLMIAFLDHWLGQTPVSEEVKQALGGRP